MKTEHESQTVEPNNCIHMFCGYCEYSMNFACPFATKFEASKNCQDYEEE